MMINAKNFVKKNGDSRNISDALNTIKRKLPRALLNLLVGRSPDLNLTLS